ncbi:MAG TPA: AI-2E family transporter [Bryobacteraceae bacterium]|nr:AI-2E family transporter [Bryobacteraceae bacterium]
MLARGQPNNTGKFLKDSLWLFAAYVRGQLLIALWMVVIYAVGYGFAGVPWWGLVAPVCGALHLVPFLGAALGLILPVVVSLAAGGGTNQMLAILGVFVAAQAIEGFYLTPKILGRQLRMRRVLVFVALVAGSSLFGFLGAIFAVPAVAVAVLAWRTWRGAETHVQDPPDLRNPTNRNTDPSTPSTSAQ